MSKSESEIKITLKAGGPRELVDETEAKEIAERFQQEIAAAQQQEGRNKGVVVVVVEILDLSCRSWPRSSLDCLRLVLEQVVHTIKILKIDDVIASLNTEAGLDSLEFFATMFGSSKVLEEINLNDNALGTRGDVVLAPLFQLQSLQRLAIENCGMSKEVTASLLQSLQPTTSTLTHLSLGRNQIGEEGAKHVGTLLAQCPNLQVLHYNGCRPLKTGTAWLLNGLVKMVQQQKTTSLVDLNLHDCTIGSEYEDDNDDNAGNPLKSLVTILAASPKLQILNIQDAEIGPEGLQCVLDGLKTSGANLIELSLGACELGEEGAKLLATALTLSLSDDNNNHDNNNNNNNNKAMLANLQTLRLDTNELGDEGVTILIQALAMAASSSSSSSSLLTLDLETNEIGKQGAWALIRNKQLLSLQSINLMDNVDIPAQLATKLQTLYPHVQIDDDLEEEDEDEEDLLINNNNDMNNSQQQVDDLVRQFGNTKI